MLADINVVLFDLEVIKCRQLGGPIVLISHFLWLRLLCADRFCDSEENDAIWMPDYDTIGKFVTYSNHEWKG